MSDAQTIPFHVDLSLIATAATIGGKQILLQKPLNISGQNVLQLVKTSQGTYYS